MRKSLSIFLFILIVVLVAGCTQSESLDEERSKRPDTIHHKFLFYTESNVNENGESIGELSIKTKDGELEKIASGVKNYGFVYLNDKDKVLFVDEENKLYEFQMGKDKVKLAEDVQFFDGYNKEDFIVYQDMDMNLYVIKNDGKEEKIGSEVAQYDLVDGNLYYTDFDGDYSVYNIESRKQSDIANNVVHFKILNRDGDLVYVNDDYMLFYKKADEGSVKISSNEIDPYYIKNVDDRLIYLSYEKDDAMDLYSSTLSSDVTTEKVASNVYLADYDKNSFYYLNEDNNLYQKGEYDEKATKLASDVQYFYLVEGTVYYTDEEYNIYKVNSADDKEQIAEKVYQFNVHTDGRVVYLTEEDELFIDETKVASDIEMYAFFHGNLVYATKDNELVFMQDLEEEQVIEDIRDFSSVMYQNLQVFSNQLTFDDISGLWKFEDDYGAIFFEISADGTVADYLAGTKEIWMVDYAESNTIAASSENGFVTITKLDDETLTFSDSYSEYTLTKATKEEADSYVNDVQREENNIAIETLIQDFLFIMTYATDTGDLYDLDFYIDPNSDLYHELADSIMKMYENQMGKVLLTHEITDIKSLDGNRYEVIVEEEHSVIDYTDYYEEIVEQTVIYELEEVDDWFYIRDIEVVEHGNAVAV
ncbi:hypothetical protein [Oceanobacillus sp. Castelsardo]|uniref:TcaA NTF2-like domain-containing protein n=1 Tax=Oceanobacillus sp. Castelsardo TaxID=1851204 RepID=UPI000839320D|nr:hypothetical protein [Oceanobacillus sp. Castelsardo]